MATQSTVTIVNKALTLCGANTISSLTEDTNNARIVNTIYAMSRQEILTECKWIFATTRSTLVTVATTTIAWYHTNEAYVYNRPAEALRIFELSDDKAEWREEGSYIICDTAGLGAKYVFDQTDVSKYPPMFIKAFIDLLCSEICFKVLNSIEKAKMFLELYEKISLPKAMAENSQVGLHQVMTDDAWEAAKYSNENPAA